MFNLVISADGAFDIHAKPWS